MTQTAVVGTVTEFALMVEWGDGQPAEFVAAKSAEHAEQMARTIYSAQCCWTVGREVQPWRYVQRGDTVLTGAVAR